MFQLLRADVFLLEKGCISTTNCETAMVYQDPVKEGLVTIETWENV